MGRFIKAKDLLKNLVLVMCFVTVGTVHAQISGCKKLKTGKFKIEDEYSGTILITRTEGIQREENTQFGTITEDKIKWINNCTFRLTPFRVIKNESELDLSMDFKLEVEIIEIKDGSYIQKTTSRRTKQSIVAEVKILE